MEHSSLGMDVMHTHTLLPGCNVSKVTHMNAAGQDLAHVTKITIMHGRGKGEILLFCEQQEPEDVVTTESQLQCSEG